MFNSRNDIAKAVGMDVLARLAREVGRLNRIHVLGSRLGREHCK